MKVRTDFVSNSSSSSFILTGENAGKGLKILRQAIKGLNSSCCEDLYIRLTAADEEKALDISNAVISGRDTDSWDPKTVSSSFSSCDLDKLTDEMASALKSVRFESSDSWGREAFFLKILYLFFDRNGCDPDCSGSEQDFMEYMNSEEQFLAALTTYNAGRVKEKPDDV